MEITLDVLFGQLSTARLTTKELKFLRRHKAFTFDIDTNTLSINLDVKVVQTKESHVKAFVEKEWLHLFPTELIPMDKGESYRVSGNSGECVRRMRTFIKEHKYDYNTIYAATCAYLWEKCRNQYRGTMKNMYFISKQLEVYCELMQSNPTDTLENAKNYLRHVERLVRGVRRGRILDGFGKSILRGGLDPNPTLFGGGNDEQSSAKCEQPEPLKGGYFQPLKLRTDGAWTVDTGGK